MSALGAAALITAIGGALAGVITAAAAWMSRRQSPPPVPPEQIERRAGMGELMASMAEQRKLLDEYRREHVRDQRRLERLETLEAECQTRLRVAEARIMELGG